MVMPSFCGQRFSAQDVSILVKRWCCNIFGILFCPLRWISLAGSDSFLGVVFCSRHVSIYTRNGTVMYES
nr:hypothetical protein CFP56_52078 [Quercus suber]